MSPTTYFHPHHGLSEVPWGFVRGEWADSLHSVAPEIKVVSMVFFSGRSESPSPEYVFSLESFRLLKMC